MAQSRFVKTVVRGQLPAVVLMAALLVSSVLGLHWSIKLGILLCGLFWYRVIEKMSIPRFHYLAIALATGCALLLEFGSLGDAAQRGVNGILAAMVVIVFLSLVWQVIAVTTFASKTLAEARREVRSIAGGAKAGAGGRNRTDTGR